MIDFGPIPRAIIKGVNGACANLEGYIENTAKKMWADYFDEETVNNFERTLNIVNKPSLLADRIKNVLAYKNSNGSANVSWFYELAGFLGYKQGIYSGEIRIKGIRNNGTWIFPTEYNGPAICFADGETLPFRAGISKVGDKMYDSVTFGATTCIVYYRQGNAAEDFSLPLKDLIRAARNIGTVLVFAKTD